jgi:hypothetical protein
MFLVTEADADAIHAIFNQEGELSAAIEQRRRFPGITDNVKADVPPQARWKAIQASCCLSDEAAARSRKTPPLERASELSPDGKPPPSQSCTVTRLRSGVRESKLHSTGAPHAPSAT